MPLKIALVVPHMFMQEDIMKDAIFSPGHLAISLADALHSKNIDVTLFTPGPVNTRAKNITANREVFESVLAEENRSYVQMLKQSPLAFISLSRQLQNELISDVYSRANNNEFDVVHIYTNEEEQALSFAKLCNKPVVFTHHDPFNLSTKYRAIMPKYKQLAWISISDSQRKSMPKDANWVDTIHHGIDSAEFNANLDIKREPKSYVAFVGRIIKNKGTHHAINAVLAHNKTNPEKPITLKIAGKHYSDHNDSYWNKHVAPHLYNKYIEYVGYIGDSKEKEQFMQNAHALIVPSLFEEPFGMVMIEALACGTPIIGLDSGAIPEIITEKTGILVKKLHNDAEDDYIVNGLSRAITEVESIKRKDCRLDFENRFTLDKMADNHIKAYAKLAQNL